MDEYIAGCATPVESGIMKIGSAFLTQGTSDASAGEDGGEDSELQRMRGSLMALEAGSVEAAHGDRAESVLDVREDVG
ncbi:hypothetical protein CERSUDRAFT_118249 [Gelatoporia subvermispora B]|uniref:Uncharacterized protein n=1 Tax=Ceriporiopsis subvermispora (strain B) TaxID=914234 RepID=M2Q8K2_CERS8|nr:hypothetical protein CERSUDRAFT_118249 [Gelatoporia subvermispora B]